MSAGASSRPEAGAGAGPRCAERVALFVERSNGQVVLGPPKSKARTRVVGIPKAIKPVLAEHLSLFVGAAPGALLFPGAKGGPLRQGNFNKQSAWPHAAVAIGAEGLHFHDLRHTGERDRGRQPRGTAPPDGPDGS